MSDKVIVEEVASGEKGKTESPLDVVFREIKSKDNGKSSEEFERNFSKITPGQSHKIRL